VFSCFFHRTDKKCATIYLWSIQPNELQQVSHTVLCSGIIFIELEGKGKGKRRFV